MLNFRFNSCQVSQYLKKMSLFAETALLAMACHFLIMYNTVCYWIISCFPLSNDDNASFTFLTGLLGWSYWSCVKKLILAWVLFSVDTKIGLNMQGFYKEKCLWEEGRGKILECCVGGENTGRAARESILDSKWAFRGVACIPERDLSYYHCSAQSLPGDANGKWPQYTGSNRSPNSAAAALGQLGSLQLEVWKAHSHDHYTIQAFMFKIIVQVSMLNLTYWYYWFEDSFKF